jgi:Na+-translocating ferredoxin:NAD+ oxidoreductase RNF subunit RnfB
MSLITAVAALGGLGFVLASLLIAANRKLRVFEDPRIAVVEDQLPHANCGACGFAGCHAFAEALVEGAAAPAGCTVNSGEGNAAIAAYLGVDAGSQRRRVARLACAGGSNVAPRRAHYSGPQSCVEAAQVSGGGKACFWGCLGYGDCERACDFDAIRMNEHDLPVVSNADCTACGDCVDICPKDLFSLQPADSPLWVACASREHGDAVLESCAVGCTACERCVVDDREGLLSMRDNLPVVDSSRPARDSAAIERCPTGAIVWIDATGTTRRGAAARPVVRRAALPEAAT